MILAMNKTYIWVLTRITGRMSDQLAMPQWIKLCIQRKGILILNPMGPKLGEHGGTEKF